jgi:Ankyrin repeats (3 copies)
MRKIQSFYIMAAVLSVLSMDLTGCVTAYKAIVDGGKSRIQILGPVPEDLRIYDDDGQEVTIEKHEISRSPIVGTDQDRVQFGFFLHVNNSRDHTLTLRHKDQTAKVSMQKHIEWLWFFATGAFIVIDIADGAANEFPDFYATDYFALHNEAGAKYANAKEMQLINAALIGDLSEVKNCVSKKGINVDVIDQDGSTALISAAILDNSDVVQYLLSAGANASLKDDYGFTALAYAKALKNNDVVDMLEKAR